VTAATLYDWLLFGHILAAMVWVGAGVLLAAQAILTVRSADPGAVPRFVRGLRILGPAVLAPATIAVAGLGVWLVLDSAAWDFGQGWVQVALALFAVAFVVGAAHQSRAAIHAERAVKDGDEPEARRQLVRWSWGYAVIVTVLVAIAWDMVFKPGL
jgi:uncharacterized membrane protein